MTMTDPTSSLPAVRRLAADAAESFYVLGDRIALRGDLAGSNLTMIDVTIPPGGGVPPHTHASPETFRVLEGRVSFWRATDTGSEEIEAGPGDVVVVPSDVPHGYRNAGTAPAVVMVLLEPAMVAFFRAMADPAPLAGPPTPEILARVGALTTAHGIRMLAA